MSLFGQHIVGQGDITEEDGRFLAASQTRRQKADYDYEPLDEDIAALLKQTRRFMDRIDDLLSIQ